jgi:hypothetical protein
VFRQGRCSEYSTSVRTSETLTGNMEVCAFGPDYASSDHLAKAVSLVFSISYFSGLGCARMDCLGVDRRDLGSLYLAQV